MVFAYSHKYPRRGVNCGNGILKYLLFALAGYVSGSIMYSYLIPKLFCGVDIVKEGEDHNPGMTNVMRCVSVKLGVLCLLLDVAKGFAPVFLAKLYVPDFKICSLRSL